ncbi:MAG: hypothetical protein V3R70_02060, partial [Syntrophobacteria bacterium]
LPFFKVFRQGFTSHLTLPSEPVVSANKAVLRPKSWVTYEPGCVNGGATGVTLFFLSKVHEQAKPSGRLLHNEQFAPFYGSVAFENAPNLHAGLCGAKSGRRGGSDARCFSATHLALPPFAIAELAQTGA